MNLSEANEARWPVAARAGRHKWSVWLCSGWWSLASSRLERARPLKWRPQRPDLAYVARSLSLIRIPFWGQLSTRGPPHLSGRRSFALDIWPGAHLGRFGRRGAPGSSSQSVSRISGLKLRIHRLGWSEEGASSDSSSLGVASTRGRGQLSQLARPGSRDERSFFMRLRHETFIWS